MKNYFFAGLIIFLFAGPAFTQSDTIISGVFRWKGSEVEKQGSRKRKQILDGPTVFLDRFEIHATTLKAGMAPHPPHAHETEEELIIVKEGRVSVTIEEESKVLGPGSVAFAEAGDRHGFANAGSTPATYYVIKMRSRQTADPQRGREAGGSFMIDYEDLEFRPHDRGGVRSYFNRSTALFDYFEMHVTTLNPGIQSHPPHTHKAAEIILVIEGQVEEQIGEAFYKGQTGDLFFLASQVPHAIRNRGKRPCRYFAFQWRTD